MRADRLLRLAEHLESGRLGHDWFDFTTVSEGLRKPNGCGTLGCALGEMPVIWPEDWEFYHWLGTGFVVRQKGHRSSQHDIAQWFCIQKQEYFGLFTPYRASPWNEAPLSGTATAAEVAQGIRNFVTWKHAQEAVVVPEEELVSA